MKNLTAFGGLFLMAYSLQAQPLQSVDSGRMRPEIYIEMFKDAAVEDMIKTGVPASITLAQGMYESDYGNSDLARLANNHFGIKCHKNWEGDTYHKDDDAPNECFRKYKSVTESYDDHSEFLRSRERYASLFTLEITDYKGWAHGLKKAGYATNPQYAHRLIDLIERYRLHEYDQQGSGRPMAQKEPVKDEITAVSKPVVQRPKPVGNAVTGQSSGTMNKIPFVIARRGDTWSKLARENSLDLWQILEFNDASKNDPLQEGDRVYVKAKRNRSVSGDTHILGEHESMRDVAQLYGIRLRKLYKMNEMQPGSRPAPGSRIYLNRSMLLGVVL